MSLAKNLRTPITTLLMTSVIMVATLAKAQVPTNPASVKAANPDFVANPPWWYWCVPATLKKLDCSEALWEAHNYGATPSTSPTPPPSKAVGPGTNGAPAVGKTDAAIQANFPAVFLYNFQHDTTANTHITAAGTYEIAWLSSEYYRNNGNIPALYTAFAKQLTAANLVLLRASFGSGMDTYVKTYSTAAVYAAYAASAGVQTNVVQRMSHIDYETRGLGSFVPPVFTMTQNDLWWEAFAKTGATVESACVSVALADVTAAQTAWSVGYYIGGKLYLVADALNPQINITIGNIIGHTVDDIVNTFTTTSGVSITVGPICEDAACNPTTEFDDGFGDLSDWFFDFGDWDWWDY